MLVMMTAILMSFASAAQSPGTPDVVIVNAKVHTVDPQKRSAEAVAICGETIARVGSTAEVKRLPGPSPRANDDGGRLVVPGFNDAHVHLLSGADELLGVDLRPSTSELDFAARLAAYARTLPKGRWIVGGYWDPGRGAAGPGGGGPPRGGGGGEPTGLLKDNAMGLVLRAVPADSLEDTMAKAKAALKHAAEVGVTTIQDLTASQTELRAYQALRAQGDLTSRIYSTQSHGIAGLRAAGVMTGFGDDWLRIGGVKFFVDGSMGSSTAAFFEGYADDPKNTGLLLQPPDALE